MTKLSKLTQLWLDKEGRCFYCGLETYLPGYRGETRQQARKRLGLRPGMSELRSRRASIEHLKRKIEGGTLAYDNIVLSCVDCNSRRGARAVTLWAAMRSQLTPEPLGDRGNE